MEDLKRQLCDVQGRLFELSLKSGYDSQRFVELYMNSETVEYLDKPYDRMQWAGEEYILENLVEEAGEISVTGKKFPKEVMYWMGYIYRYWHFHTGESSREIYKQADAQTMYETYLGFLILDNAMAVENLKEIYEQKRKV